MKNIEKYIPEINTSTRKEELTELWNKVYKKRKKISGLKKAKYSANAIVYSEMLKEFTNTKKDYIKNLWEQEQEEKEDSKYTIYPVEDMSVVVTTDKAVLKDYKNVDRKGMIKNAEDEFELEILDKLSDEYNIKLHPDLYYVMWSE